MASPALMEERPGIIRDKNLFDSAALFVSLGPLLAEEAIPNIWRNLIRRTITTPGSKYWVASLHVVNDVLDLFPFNFEVIRSFILALRWSKSEFKPELVLEFMRDVICFFWVAVHGTTRSTEFVPNHAIKEFQKFILALIKDTAVQRAVEFIFLVKL